MPNDTLNKVAQAIAHADGWTWEGEADFVEMAANMRRKDQSRWARYVAMAEAALEVMGHAD